MAMARASRACRLQGRIEAALTLATQQVSQPSPLPSLPLPKPPKFLERASFRGVQSGIFHCKKPPTKETWEVM